jgi:hypothetical protein
MGGEGNMQRFAFRMAALMAIMMVGTAWAGKDKEESQHRLELDLVDGSRVIGIPSIESVPVQTSYAKMDVALKQILTVKIAEDRETASVDLRNGDKLKGVINLDPIRLETVFGKVKIDIEHIRELRVVVGGKDPGLILWNKMGSDEEVQNSTVGPKGNIQGKIDTYAPGVFGNAAHLRGSAGEVYFDIPYLENKRLGTDPFTIAFWAKSSDINQPEGFIMDNLSKGTMMIRFTQHNSSTMQAAIPTSCPGMHHKWDTNYHHYAIVFHPDGRSTFYIDAVVKASSDNAASIGQAFSPRVVLSGAWDLTGGYDWNGYIDNVKAWNYAKTDFSDRTDE